MLKAVTIDQAIASHRTALGALEALNDAPDTPEVDALASSAAEAEREALDTVALAPCGSGPPYARKMAYLVALSLESADDILLDSRFTAIRTAVESWLEEQAQRLAA